MGENYRLPQSRLNLPCLTQIGWMTMDTAKSLDFHVNNGFEITYAAKGEFQWELSDGALLSIDTGQICITPYLARHRGRYGRMTGGSELFYTVFNPFSAAQAGFEPELMQALGQRYLEMGGRTMVASERIRSLLMLIKEGIQTDCQGGTGGPSSLNHLVLAFLAELPALFAQSGRAAPAVTGGRELTERAVELFKENLERDDRYTVADAAAALGVSRSRLYEVFKRHKGVSPLEYQLRLRCRAAEEFLLKTELTVTEIAYRTGFSSSQHFSRAFKSNSSYSPSEFRGRYSQGREEPFLDP